MTVKLQRACGKRFGTIFPIMLTDRGSEFSDVERIERDRNGKKRLSLYFCNPSQSQQKGRAEKLCSIEHSFSYVLKYAMC